MSETLHLFEYPLPIRIGLLVALVWLTVRYTRRGLENGLVLGLASGMAIFELFKDLGPLPILTVDRIVWPTVWSIFFLRWRRGETARHPLDTVEYCMILVLVSVVVSILTHGTYAAEFRTQERWQLGTFLRGFAMPFVAYFIARRAVVTPSQLRSLFVGIGFITAYLAFTGVAEALRIDWLVFPRSILDPTRGIHFGMVRGVFLNATHYGLALAMGLPIVILLAVVERGQRRWLWPAVVLAAGVPLLYTFERAVWLGATVALVATALAWPKRRTVFIGVMILAATVGLLFTSSTLVNRITDRARDASTINVRLDLVRTAFAMIREHPLTGVGFNRFQEETVAYSPYAIYMRYSHNTPLALLAELGMIAFMPYAAIFAFVAFKSIEIYYKKPRFRALIGVLWGTSLAYVLTMMVVELRLRLYPNALFFLLWGAAFEVIRRQAEEDQRRFPENRVIGFA
jgi:O-antigen ligase